MEGNKISLNEHAIVYSLNINDVQMEHPVPWSGVVLISNLWRIFRHPAMRDEFKMFYLFFSFEKVNF